MLAVWFITIRFDHRLQAGVGFSSMRYVDARCTRVRSFVEGSPSGFTPVIFEAFWASSARDLFAVAHARVWVFSVSIDAGFSCLLSQSFPFEVCGPLVAIQQDSRFRATQLEPLTMDGGAIAVPYGSQRTSM